MKLALKISTDGTTEELDFSVDELATLQQAVNGWIEPVDIEEGQATLWVNEEGKLQGLPHNNKAQVLWDNNYSHPDHIVGNVIITGGLDSNGATLGLTEELLETIKNQLNA
jgi:hypothetical protein